MTALLADRRCPRLSAASRNISLKPCLATKRLSRARSHVSVAEANRVRLIRALRGIDHLVLIDRKSESRNVPADSSHGEDTTIWSWASGYSIGNYED
jgi:hypothetical protein